MSETHSEPEEEWNGVDEIESLCMRCGENGMTRMMMHKIPYFRELLIASFSCDECGERNNEVTFGGEIQLQGCVFELEVTTARDLDRQIIKSDSASFRIVELDFEIPPLTQKGEISTIEGFIKTAAKNLGLHQEERMIDAPEIGLKVAEVILQLTRYSMGEVLPFHIIVNDPSGNSFIENPFVPAKDPHMKVGFYYRSAEQDISLGLKPSTSHYKDDHDSNFHALMTGGFGTGAAAGAAAASNTVETTELLPEAVGISSDNAVPSEGEEVRLGRSEIISLPSNCPSCCAPGESLTALTDIPHFKEVIIMAFNCTSCGYRNSEVRGGGAVPAKGTEVVLKARGPEDLKRDVLKSDSAMVFIPELELELRHGTLGGVYTTVEGLLMKIRNSLWNSNPFAIGDSTTKHHSEKNELAEGKQRFSDFMDKLVAYSKGEVFPFTLVIRDPLGNSFMSAPLGSFLPPEADVNLSMSDFERSFEDNEEFGLNDMNTADFETGVDSNYSKATLLPDRITHQIKKGPDHPTPFAQGVADNTPGGMYFDNHSASAHPLPPHPPQPIKEEEIEETQQEYYESSAPAGWRALRLDEALTAAADEEQDALVTDDADEDSQELEADYGKRKFSEQDVSLQFNPSEEFRGARVGFVFRMGAQGLGYYEDKKK